MAFVETHRPVEPPMPDDEEGRLDALYAYEVLDTPPEAEYDAIVALAAQICGTPIARVNLVDRDRQWTKAAHGVEPDETPRAVAICPHTIATAEGWMIVEDTLEDERFSLNPLVHDDPAIRFYAGSVINSASGQPLGAVCVIDTQPRQLTEAQFEALRNLSRMVETQLELRKLLLRERRLVEGLRTLDRAKAEFMSSVAHDFRTPLTSIRGYADLLRERGVETDVALDAIDRGAARLLHLVNDLSGTSTTQSDEVLDLSILADATVEMLRTAAADTSVTINTDLHEAFVCGSGHRLAQVLENLIANAVKYSPEGVVTVTSRVEGERAVVEVTDTGVGIAADEVGRLFDRFFRASTANGFPGTGVGLATVKSIVEAHGGTILVDSEVGRGTSVSVSFPATSARDA
jgi:signal transduction histidine kinase